MPKLYFYDLSHPTSGPQVMYHVYHLGPYTVNGWNWQVVWQVYMHSGKQKIVHIRFTAKLQA